MPALKLVIANRNYSSWSLRAWLVLERTRAPFEEIQIPLRQPGTDAEIRRYSPSGRLPVLIDGPLVVWDSLAIAEQLAEKFGGARLWPTDPVARGMARSACAEMHSGFSALRQTLPMNIRRRRPGSFSAPSVQQDIARITELWTGLRQRFGAGGPYLFREWGIADAFFTPIAARFRSYGVPLPPEAAAYRDTLLAWPAFRRWEAEAEREPWSIPEYDG
jgi:glutathione S-transferase